MCFIRRLHLRSGLITEIQQQQSAMVKYCCHCCQSPTDSPTEKRLSFSQFPASASRAFFFWFTDLFCPTFVFLFGSTFSVICPVSVFFTFSSSFNFPLLKANHKKARLEFCESGQNFWFPSVKKRKTHISHWNNLKLAKVIKNKYLLKVN